MQQNVGSLPGGWENGLIASRWLDAPAPTVRARPLALAASASCGTSFGLLWQPQNGGWQSRQHIKESQLENKPDLPPPSHCLLDEDVVEDLYEQDLPKGHSFTLRTRPHQGTQLFPPPHPNRGSVAARCTYLLKYYSSTWVHCPSTQVPTPLHCWSRSDLLIPSSRLCSAAWANRSTGPCHQSLSSGRKCSVQM